MRIHSDIITRTHVFESAQNAHVRAFSVTEHGSRKRDHAVVVYLSGSSPYRSQTDREEYAATWDEWGIFIRTLFQIDPSAIIGDYPDLETFQRFTGERFDTLTPATQHRRHKWEYDGVGHSCTCGAVARYSELRGR